jgi:hypothetical protein
LFLQCVGSLVEQSLDGRAISYEFVRGITIPPPSEAQLAEHLSLSPKTACQRKPTASLALSSSVRRDLEHFARLRPLHRPSRPKQHWDFHQPERRLTSHRSGDIAQARKKGGLKFLYRHLANAALLQPILSFLLTFR